MPFSVSYCLINKYKIYFNRLKYLETNQIYYRRATVKGQTNRNGVYLCWRCTSNGNRIEASDGASHYQELNANKEESTFQTTSLQ